MKKLALLIACLLCFASISQAAPAAPQMSYSLNGTNITVDWSDVPDVTGYTLYYAAYPYHSGDTIYSMNNGNSTTFSIDLWDGAAYYIAVTASNETGESAYSNIDFFIMRPPTDDMTETETESRQQLLDLVRDYRDEKGNHFLHISMDLGGDGDKDLIALNWEYHNDTTLNTLLPMSYFVNNLGAGFERVDTNISMGSRYHEVVDVNGDGLEDLISVSDHIERIVGNQTYREDKVRLLLQDANGALIDASDQVTEIYADWHGLESLDIDLDGDVDFIASGLHDSIYVFINDGFGNFTADQSMLPISELNLFQGNDDRLFFTNIHSLDLNNDGRKEILLGGDESHWFYTDRIPRMPILRYEGGGYTFDSRVDTLDVYYKESDTDNAQVVTEMQSMDFNQDHCEDLVVYQTDYSTNSIIKLFESDCSGGLALAQQFHNDGRWNLILNIKDINGDGLEDIYMSDNDATWYLHTPLVYINGGDGVFSRANDISSFNFDLLTYLFYYTYPRNLNVPGRELTFADTNLQQCVDEVAAAQGVADSLLGDLDCNGYNIRDLSGIENITYLESLFVSGNQIVDISALEGMNYLRTLHLNANQISDISVLQGLTNLQNLSIYDNCISDLSPVSHVPNVEGIERQGYCN